MKPRDALGVPRAEMTMAKDDEKNTQSETPKPERKPKGEGAPKAERKPKSPRSEAPK